MGKKLLHYRLYCNTESAYGYIWSETTPTVCPNNNAHSIDTNTISVIDIVKETADFDSNGRMIVNPGGYTQFGDQRVSIYNPLFQNYALYNIINSQIYTIFTGSGGTVTGDPNGTELDLNITTTVGSYAVVRSTKVCKYRPGYNLVVRWNTLFATPVANLLQFAGLGNNGSDIYFCYNGTDFGVRYSKNGFSEIRQFTVTVAETSTTTATITLNGVATVINLTNASGNTAFTAYQISRGSYSGWLVTAIGSVVRFTAETVGTKSGTYSYVSSGASTGTFSQIKAGQSLTTTFINRTNWNGSSSMVADLNPLMRNMYAIEYTWYGSGNMTFEVYNPDTASYEVVHTIKFANLQEEPSLSQPNMYLQQGIASLGSTTAKTIKMAGGFGAVEGNFVINYPLYSVDNLRSISSNTETVILAIKNRNNIYGFTNNSEILIRQLSFNAEGNKPVRIRIIRNPDTLSANTTSNYVNWQYIDEEESIGLVDKTSLTFTGGHILATYYLPRSGSLMVDLTGKEITVFRTDVVIFTAFSTSLSDIDCAITMVEDY